MKLPLRNKKYLMDLSLHFFKVLRRENLFFGNGLRATTLMITFILALRDLMLSFISHCLILFFMGLVFCLTIIRAIVNTLFNGQLTEKNLMNTNWSEKMLRKTNQISAIESIFWKILVLDLSRFPKEHRLILW